MRDDRHNWAAPPDPWAPVALGDAILSPVVGLRQTLISGPTVLRGTDTIGWPEPATGDVYQVALRRDRVLAIGGPKLAEGWDIANNRALSDASDLYAVFDLSGNCALALIKRGAEVSLGLRSRSASRLLFGLGVVLYRHEEALRLHVPRAQAQALAEYLAQAAKQMEQ